MKQFEGCVKRMMDAGISASLLIVLGPLLLLIWALVRVTMGYPAIFRQERAGRQGRPFVLYKFRTMTPMLTTEDGVPPPGYEPACTALGRVLRQYSLDELPQLWNVLKGDMSLVGPRPLLMRYLPRYTAAQQRRHEVLPGITGWAQVNGRNTLTWERRFELDVYYVDHFSLALDCRILWLTLTCVLRRSGVQPVTGEIMAEFQGAKREMRLSQTTLEKAP